MYLYERAGGGYLLEYAGESIVVFFEEDANDIVKIIDEILSNSLGA